MPQSYGSASCRQSRKLPLIPSEAHSSAGFAAPAAHLHQRVKTILNTQGKLPRITKPHPIFVVEVVISNKATAKDPEGDVIHRDLVKSHFPQAKSIRVGKLLRFKVEAVSPLDAQTLVQRMCDELRIYNPAAHDCQVAPGRLDV